MHSSIGPYCSKVNLTVFFCSGASWRARVLCFKKRLCLDFFATKDYSDDHSVESDGYDSPSKSALRSWNCKLQIKLIGRARWTRRVIKLSMHKQLFQLEPYCSKGYLTVFFAALPIDASALFKMNVALSGLLRHKGLLWMTTAIKTRWLRQ